nr:MAG: hypothetical protein [Bacteriophage sp.]
MNTEMYARNGGKALPEGNLNVVKVINFVDEEGQPVAFGQGPAGPAGPAGPITKAAHVDPSTGTVAEIVGALVAAGLMESA